MSSTARTSGRAQDPATEEGRHERLNRELGELLQELRVVLPGVQVLFAFLLTVPFSQRFGDVTPTQRTVFFVSLLSAASATAFLIAPSTYHRIQWRGGDKERMLRTSNVLSLIGTGFLAVSMCSALFVVTDLLFVTSAPTVITASAAALFGWLWFGLPALRHLRGRGSSPA